MFKKGDKQSREVQGTAIPSSGEAAQRRNP